MTEWHTNATQLTQCGETIVLLMWVAMVRPLSNQTPRSRATENWTEWMADLIVTRYKATYEDDGQHRKHDKK